MSPSKPTTVTQFTAAVDAAIQAAGTKPPARVDGRSGRFYDVDGDLLPSVTHILGCIGKPALINWAANQERTLCMEAAADLYEDCVKLTKQMPRTAYLTTLQGRIGKVKAHQRELAKASEIGKQAHALIEWSIRKALGQKVGPEPKVVDDAQWAYMSWEDWARSVSLKPIFIEQIVFSRVHGYAGTMDLLAEVNGVRTLVDFKTSKAVYPESFLQNVSYQVCLSEMGHHRADAGLILRLPKLQTDPAFEAVPVPLVTDLFPVFLAVKELWKWTYANDEAYRRRREAESAAAS